MMKSSLGGRSHRTSISPATRMDGSWQRPVQGMSSTQNTSRHKKTLRHCTSLRSCPAACWDACADFHA
eukprot:9184795-Alexandrium_andersonii.AAC.1